MTSDVLPHLSKLHIGILQGLRYRRQRHAEEEEKEQDGEEKELEVISTKGLRWLVKRAIQLETLSVNGVNITPRLFVTILRLDESKGYRLSTLHIANSKHLTY